MMDPLSLGLTVFTFGIVLLGGMLLFRRFIPRLLAMSQSTQPASLATGLAVNPLRSGSESLAVLLVKTGGRVVFANPTARNWFGLVEEEPNLERLARRTRPEELFLGLCAVEGQTRFSLNEHLIDG